jgi:hypothetical protein
LFRVFISLFPLVSPKTKFTGNGSLMQVLASVTNTPQRFFRVRQP